jgi:hypothetical protein
LEAKFTEIRPLLISAMTESMKSKLTCRPFLFRLGCFFCLLMVTKGLMNFWSTYFRTLPKAELLVNGTPVSPNIGVLQVWQKEKGKWKLIARQAYKI